MRKFAVLIAAVALAAAVSAVSAVSASEGEKVTAPEEAVEVTNFGKKAPVTFDHGFHATIECTQCHHKADEGAYKCGECHGADEGEAMEIKDAFHKRDVGVCYSCHLAKGAEHKMRCSDCHQK